ncbi:MAG: hypothetical protein KDA44_05140 [Planctomycetales bacterium]|nr:hypothetical protein [Planctomycetales bacterium]
MTSATGRWQTIEIGGHACHAYEPPEPSPHGDTVLYLHCVNSVPLAEHPAFERLFDQYGLRCLAPVTGRSWWADRVSPDFDPAKSAEQYVLHDVLPWLGEQWGVRPPAVALLGISMGGQGALKLAYKHPNTFPVAAAISSAIDYQQWVDAGDPCLSQMYADPEAARQDTATLHIHPLNWPRQQWFCCDPADELWYDGNDRLRMKLYSLGVPHTCDLDTSAGGHCWEYNEHMAPAALEFIHQSLEHERLRVV